MNRLRKFISRFDIYDGLAFGLMACILFLALAYWHNYPVHMDSFYHMGVTSGYSSAGGIALHAFWEFAPAGRAQLYPPLLHVLMFALTKCGLSMLSVGRLVSFAAFPLLLVSGWYGMRRIFSSRAAFYCTVLMSSCYLLFWHSAVESAASLVLILTPLIFVAVDRSKKVAAAILLALALYSHLTLGHLVALGLLMYAVQRRKMFKEIFIVLAGAYLLWLPWGIQILMHYNSLSFSSPGATGATVHVLIWAVALAGFVYCYFKKEKYYLLPSFLLGMIPIVFFYPDRFWNAHVFLPLAMLGGVALSALHGFLREKAASLFNKRAVVTALMAVTMMIPVALFLFVDPVYSAGGGMQGVPGMGQQQGTNQGDQLQQQSPQPPGQQGTNQGDQLQQQGGGATTIQIQGQPNGSNLQAPPTGQGGPGNAGVMGGPGQGPGG